jgi:hypothetical protein
MVNNAFERWRQDSYLLTFPYKVYDPGVILKHEGEKESTYCPNKCNVIKVTFDPSVGKDTYVIQVDSTTHLPLVIDMDLVDKKGRLGYGLSDWTEVGGLKFPQKFDNLGFRDSGSGTEVWLFSEIAIGDPEDELYVPQVK